MLRSASIWTAMRPETRIQPPLSAPRNGRGWVEHLQRFAPERMASGGRHRAGPFGRMLGAAIGYEVSHRMSLRPSRLSSARASAPRMTPMLSATPRGSLVGGMMGSF